MAQRHAPIGVHNTRECLALVELYQSCHKKHILSFNACLEERKVMEACLYLEFENRVAERKDKMEEKRARMAERLSNSHSHSAAGG